MKLEELSAKDIQVEDRRLLDSTDSIKLIHTNCRRSWFLARRTDGSEPRMQEGTASNEAFRAQ